MMECEIRWCRQSDNELIHVNENIGDGAWRVGICRECARRLGLKQGDDLPPAYIVREMLLRPQKGGNDE